MTERALAFLVLLLVVLAAALYLAAQMPPKKPAVSPGSAGRMAPIAPDNGRDAGREGEASVAPREEQRKDPTPRPPSDVAERADVLAQAGQLRAAGDPEGALHLLIRAHRRDSEDPALRRALQAGYRELATQHLNRGESSPAQTLFREAAALDPDDYPAQVGLATASYKLRDLRAAKEALQMALQIRPRDRFTLQFLGEIAYQEDAVDEAIRYWEAALKEAPGDTILIQLLKKARREAKTSREFRQEAEARFVVKFDGQENSETYRDVLGILEEAYREVGQGLEWHPRREVYVLLYSRKQFRDITRVPSWAGALFDGKIRMPVQGYKPGRDYAKLERILRHEYVHAVIHDLAGGPRVPVWLNEGLAQHFEPRTATKDPQALAKEIHRRGLLPPLRALEGSFGRLDSRMAAIAYDLSAAAVAYAVERYGLYRLRGVLDEVAKGRPFPDAFRDQVVPLEEFERRWHRELEGR